LTGDRGRPGRSRKWLVSGGASLAAVGLAVTLAWELNGRVVSVADSLTSTQCQNLVVPAYFYPGADWTLADHGRPVPRIMIMDAAGPGAGNGPERDYQKAVQQAQAAGITVVGYSDTDYARRPAGAVEADVRKYKAWYGVTSIFLDEVSGDAGQFPYYRQLARYIRGTNPGAAILLNPGTYPDQRYMSVGDIVVVFENTYANYASLQVPGWVRRYPAARFADIVYASAAGQLAHVLALAVQRHAGYVYVTDGTGLPRYGSLPSYWYREDAVIARCASGRDSAGQQGSS
jgi:hypothetical protein